MSSHAYDRTDPGLSIGTLLFVGGGALFTLGLCWLTGYLDRAGYRLAQQLGVALLFFLPGALYWRMHPAWRARLADVGAAPRVGAATGTAVALGLVTALGIGAARHGVPVLTSLQALTLGLFVTLFTLVGGYMAASIFRQEAMKRNRPPEATMPLGEFLALPTAERPPRNGSAGVESEWSTLHDFHLRGSRIQLIDVMRAGKDDDGAIARTRPSEWVIEGRVMTYGDERRVSRLRVRAFDVANLVRRERIGTVDVPSGVLAICDVDRLALWATAHADDWHTWHEALSQALVDPVGDYPCEPTGTIVVFAATGFGAGTYDVFNLVSGNRVAGVEIEFIPFGTRFPV